MNTRDKRADEIEDRTFDSLLKYEYPMTFVGRSFLPTSSAARCELVQWEPGQTPRSSRRLTRISYALFKID
jgi:hypothetical protein